jgi:glycosyltransferase involved in cell wall biosynthesis
MNHLGVSCIIPAFNEAARIKPILDLLGNHPLINEIIVVDDGSTDTTRDVVQTCKKVTLVCHAQNKGKTAALYTGILHANHDLLCFLDADLIGLTEADITDLILPVQNGRADISISMRKNSPWIDRWIGLDFISGERVFHKQLIQDHLEYLPHLPKWGFEVFLNRILLQRKSVIAIIFWKNVSSPFKVYKYGFRRGLKRDLQMVYDILSVASPFEIVQQFIQMYRLKRRYVAA